MLSIKMLNLPNLLQRKSIYSSFIESGLLRGSTMDFWWCLLKHLSCTHLVLSLVDWHCYDFFSSSNTNEVLFSTYFSWILWENLFLPKLLCFMHSSTTSTNNLLLFIIGIMSFHVSFIILRKDILVGGRTRQGFLEWSSHITAGIKEVFPNLMNILATFWFFNGVKVISTFASNIRSLCGRKWSSYPSFLSN